MSTTRSRRRTSSCARRSASLGSRACRSSASASSATGTRRAAASPRGRTSRGRSRSTASPPPRSASAATACGSSRRPIPAARSGSRQRCCRTSSSSGSPRARSAYPCAGPRIGSSTSLRARRATGRVTTVEAGFTRDGELTALRYDAIEDVGAYVRAPEPATLYRMHGSLSGAYRVRDVAARYRVVLTNTIPSGLNRGFGGPQLYFGLERVMAIAARRLGLDHAELARRNLVPPSRCRTARRRARSTTRATTRRASTARSSWRSTRRSANELRAHAPRDGSPASGSRASSSPRSRTWATSRSRRRRSSGRRRCRSRATRRARP